jgi:hypothetical protein
MGAETFLLRRQSQRADHNGGDGKNGFHFVHIYFNKFSQ